MLLWTLASMYLFSNSCFFFLPRSGIAGPYGSSIFSYLNSLRNVFCSCCTNLHSYQQCKGVPFLCIFTNICYLKKKKKKFVIWGMFGDGILTGVRCYLIVVSMCFSLMIHDFEHLFMYVLAICMSSVEKCLFRSLAHW